MLPLLAKNSEIIEEATITEPPTTNCQYNGSPNMSTASNVANTLSKDNNIPLVVVDTRFIPYRHRKYGMIEHKIARKKNAPNGNAMVPITLKLPLNSVAIQASTATVPICVRFNSQPSYCLLNFDEYTMCTA